MGCDGLECSLQISSISFFCVLLLGRVEVENSEVDMLTMFTSV